MGETRLLDQWGRAIRLTDERRAHILEHPEMAGLEAALAATVLSPVVVIQSLSDATVCLYYRPCGPVIPGVKFLCAVVKVASDDAFLVTAYLTDRVKKGVRLWPANT